MASATCFSSSFPPRRESGGIVVDARTSLAPRLGGDDESGMASWQSAFNGMDGRQQFQEWQ
jgi:hypothetical protein